MLGFISDIHVGNHRQHGGPKVDGINSRCRMVLDALDGALAKAVEVGVTDLFIAGDLFDTDKPEPVLITAVLSVLEQRTTMRVHILAGNHDRTSMGKHHNAISPLDGAFDDQVRVYEKPVPVFTGHGVVLAIPYDTTDPLETIAKFQESVKIDVVCMHCGIRDAHTPSFMHGGIHARDLFNLKEVKVVMAGDWHTHKRWEKDGMTLMQIGALVPTGYDNPGLQGYGTLAVIDDRGRVTTHTIPGPRFVRTSTYQQAINKITISNADCPSNKLYVKVSCTPDKVVEVSNKLKQEQGLAGFTIEIVDPEGHKLSTEAAASVASSESVDAAVVEYVKSMDLPQVASDDEIIQRCRAYLRGNV